MLRTFLLLIATISYLNASEAKRPRLAEEALVPSETASNEAWSTQAASSLESLVSSPEEVSASASTVSLTPDSVGFPTSLPRWNLSDLYESMEDPNIDRDMGTCVELMNAFRDSYENKLLEDNGLTLLASIKDIEKIYKKWSRLTSYKYLVVKTHLNNPEVATFLAKIKDLHTSLSAQMVFHRFEISGMKPDQLASFYSETPELRNYKMFLEEIVLWGPHMLGKEAEEVIVEKKSTIVAWERLYNERLSGIRYMLMGEHRTEAFILEELVSSDRKRREAAFDAFVAGLRGEEKIMSLTLNVITQDMMLENARRNYKTPDHSRHIDNMIEPEVVENLFKAVKAAYPKTTHRYYRIKARLMGLDFLEYYDRNAPLSTIEEPKYTWEEAKSVVLEAYESFSPELARIGKLFFDHGWIDADIYDGKVTGAFSHPTVCDVHPYILLNFQGKFSDVTTLAHELGHGIHQYLAREVGDIFQCAPLTLAETASLFGEMLTFQSLLSKVSDDRVKVSILMSKIQDSISTIQRQMAFYDFELRVHTRRIEGELTTDEINAIFLETQREMFGDGLRVDDKAGIIWSTVTDFFDSPFYVYAYPFGECLVNSLYKQYRKEPHGFVEKYLDLLKAGNSKPYTEVLAPMGLDPREPTFWDQGLQTLVELIDELETLTAKISMD